MGARFFNLENGKYQLYLNEKLQSDFEISEVNREVEFVLSPEKLVKLKIEKIN